MKIENELKNKEIVYMKLVSGEDVFAMIDIEVLKNIGQDNLNDQLKNDIISLHCPFVLKTLMPSVNQPGMQPTSIEYATKWCPYNDTEEYNSIAISTRFIMAAFKPQNDMIARYLDWLISENTEESEIDEIDEMDAQTFRPPNGKLH